MESKFQIISDGDCDLPQELTEKENVKVVPFYVSFDDTNYRREGIDVSVRDFYQEMVDKPKQFPKSSMPSVQDYADVFEPFAKEGIPMICICITQKFSGSYQSATVAAGMIREEYPQAQIEVIDSTLDTVLQGQYVLEAVDMRDRGYSYEETVAQLHAIKDSGRILFTVGNLRYLQKGGRIGKLTGIAGTLLDIKPLITLKDGEIYPSGICRGREKSKASTRKMMLEYVKETGKKWKDLSVSIGYGYDYEEAVAFREEAVTFLNEHGIPAQKEELPLYQIGATISVHTGPYPLGFGVLCRHQ